MTSGDLKTYIVDQKKQGRKANKLLEEQSPYLLQHAFNPIHWYPWGEEAFSRARTEGKPIFLSIGYSTCHWCHVMARESFENEEVAETLNRDFVCIKVDREERPDIDHIYMTAIQAITGRGGWPLTAFLTPELKPFYGGTYFPPEDRYGMPGLKKILATVIDAWQNQSEKLLDTAERIIGHLENITFQDENIALAETVLDECFRKLEKTYDPTHGGFDKAPKFPRPVVFNFLIRYYYSSGGTKALDMTLETLQKMADGGMHDHLGGGFHRYSVDNQWLVPHFEKMLYDQAQLAQSYIEAYQVTGDELYAGVARDILEYVLRDMTSPEGGFYSAEDADSPDKDDPEKHGEGLFYLWKKAEIEEVLGGKEAEVFNFHYGIRPGGNALDDPHQEFVDKNIIHVARPLRETADHFKLETEELVRLLAESRRKMYEVRNRRPRPHLDDKILTGINGLMLGAFARAGRVLEDDRYLAAALRSASFLREKLYNEKDGKLLRRYREGEAGLKGQLEDYAFLIRGLLELYEASFQPEWLRWALELNARELELFEDRQGGGFFATSGGDDSVLVRMKPGFDGAEPTGNSVSAFNLIYLGRLTDDSSLVDKGRKTIEAFSGSLHEYPPILPEMLVAYNYLLAHPWQIVIAGPRDRDDTRKMLGILGRKFLPHTTVILVDPEWKEELSDLLPPLFTGLEMQNNKATAYICKDFSCQLPITDPAELEEKL